MTDPYQLTRDVHPDLAAHGAIFARKVYRAAGNVYCAVGWSTCNSIMVVGHDGVIIVDTGDSVVAAREVAAEFRKITEKPARDGLQTLLLELRPRGPSVLGCGPNWQLTRFGWLRIVDQRLGGQCGFGRRTCSR